MRMEVKDQSKVVEFWLTREEKNNKQFLDDLKSLYRQYHSQSYLVVVFYSGE